MGLGGAEAANFPIGTQAIRAWAPREEYGVSVASMSLGQWFGTAFGAMFVGWIVSNLGWRAAFVLTGILGLVWVAIWALFVRDPQRARWLGADERDYILQEREARPAQQAGGANVKALLSSRSLWALSLAQGCFVYEAYMLLSWLPNFLQTQHHVSIFSSGGYTAIIYGTAVLGSILLARLSDKIFSTKALRGGARKWVVAFSYLPAMLVAVVPQVNSVWVIVALLTVSVTFLANGISLNTALCNDLVVRPGRCRHRGGAVHTRRQPGGLRIADRDRLRRASNRQLQHGLRTHRTHATARRCHPAGPDQGRHRQSRPERAFSRLTAK